MCLLLTRTVLKAHAKCVFALMCIPDTTFLVPYTDFTYFWNHDFPYPHDLPTIQIICLCVGLFIYSKIVFAMVLTQHWYYFIQELVSYKYLKHPSFLWAKIPLNLHLLQESDTHFHLESYFFFIFIFTFNQTFLHCLIFFSCSVMLTLWFILVSLTFTCTFKSFSPLLLSSSA